MFGKEKIMSSRIKFLIGGLVIAAAVVFLIISATHDTAQFFMTVDELNAKGAAMVDKNLTVSGAVIGDTIAYDPQTLTLQFTVANVPGDMAEVEKEGGLAEVLHQAVVDPSRSKLKVVYQGAKPDLLRNEAQAILTGHLGADGVFYASDLLLKCPTKYNQAAPQQAQKN
jgi:cytochrome c-type biogenesis protein CcmE